MTVGRVGTFVDVLRDAAPDTMLTLSAGIMDNDLDSSYRSISSNDFSRDVLASQHNRLLVIRDAVSGWTDLGNPNRVLDTLARERIAPAWLESIRGLDARGELAWLPPARRASLRSSSSTGLAPR